MNMNLRDLFVFWPGAVKVNENEISLLIFASNELCAIQVPAAASCVHLGFGWNAELLIIQQYCLIST